MFCCIITVSWINNDYPVWSSLIFPLHKTTKKWKCFHFQFLIKKKEISAQLPAFIKIYSETKHCIVIGWHFMGLPSQQKITNTFTNFMYLSTCIRHVSCIDAYILKYAHTQYHMSTYAHPLPLSCSLYDSDSTEEHKQGAS